MIYRNSTLITVLTLLATASMNAMEIEENKSNPKKRTAPLPELVKESITTRETTSDAVVDSLCSLVCALKLATRKPLIHQEDKPQNSSQMLAITDPVMESLCTVIANVTLSENSLTELDAQARTEKNRTTATDANVIDALNNVFAALNLSSNEPEQTPTQELPTAHAATLSMSDQEANDQLAARLRQSLLRQRDRARAHTRQAHQETESAVVASLCNLVSKIQVTNHTQELIDQAKRDNSDLFWAAEEGALQDLCTLLDKGINPNFIYQGTTPLIVAAGNGHLFSVKTLLGAGASVNRTNDRGQTALSWAASHGYADIVPLLLAHGAHDIPDYEGKTALSCAIAHHHPEIAHTLSLYWGHMMTVAITNAYEKQYSLR